MQDPDEADAVFLGAIENDVTPMFHSLQSWTYAITASSQAGPIGKLLETCLQVVKITFGHDLAEEISGRVSRAAGERRKTGRSIGMCDKELEAFTDAFEHSERAAAEKRISAL